MSDKLDEPYVPSEMAEAEDARFLKTLRDQARAAIYADIDAERVRQDEVHGGEVHDDTHTVSDWTRFIHDYADKANESARNGDLTQARARLVEIAALAVAGLEVLDRIDAYSADKH